MKKIITAIITILITTNSFADPELEKIWGTTKPDLIDRLKLENYTTFRPEENPDYKNRIIDFFISMNPQERAVITILRIHGIPETDYCFFNEKIYSISEDWGNISRVRALNLWNTLKAKYSLESTEEKKLYNIYSLKKDKTKVLLYKKAVDEKSVNIKIFYYSTDLFSMLFTE